MPQSAGEADTVLGRMDGKHHQISRGRGDTPKLTVNNPITFTLFVLAKRNELQSLLTVWVAGWRGNGRSLSLLVLVVDDAPSTVDEGLYLMAMAKLQLD